MKRTCKLPDEFLSIERLDFTDIKQKLHTTKKWSKKICDHVEMWYKRFLAIRAKYPEARLVPNNAIDEMWHLHILDTIKYAKDCQKVFGYFLHHVPSYGKKDHSAGFDETNTYYRIEFNEDCTQMFSGALTCDMKPQTCGMECNTGKKMMQTCAIGSEPKCEADMPDEGVFAQTCSTDWLPKAAECEDTEGGQIDQK